MVAAWLNAGRFFLINKNHVMVSIYSTKGLRIFFFRITLISLGIVAVMGAIYFAMKDRFDIVACLILLVSNTSIMILFLASLPTKRRHRPYQNGDFIHYDPEHLAEHYDEGYVTGVLTYMNEIITNSDHENEPKELNFKRVKGLCTIANENPKLHLLGHFQIKDHEGKPIIIFSSRNKRTGETS